MKKITPVFGPQELFDGAPDDAELVDATGRAYKIECGKLFRKTPIQWVVADKFEATPLAQRRIIRTPTWTIVDQSAGKLPDVGCECRHCQSKFVKSVIAVTATHVVIDANNGVAPDVLHHDEFMQYYIPIETPNEKAARLNADRVKRMVELFEENACHRNYNMERGIEAVVNALTKELSVQAKDGA